MTANEIRDDTYFDQDQLYVYIESETGSFGLNPAENNPSNFEVNFKTPLKFPAANNEIWKVALEELCFPNSLYNVSSEEAVIVHQFKYTSTPGDEKPSGVFSVPGFYSAKVSIPPAFYDPMSYVQAINSRFEMVKNNFYASNKSRDLEKHPEVSLDDLKFELYFNPNSKKIGAILNPAISEKIIVSNEKLRQMLGCKTMDPVVSESRQLDFSCNFNRPFQKIFVYTDIVQSSIVGDTYSPILRIFDISNDLNATMTSLGTRNRSNKRFRMSSPMIKPAIERLHFFPINSALIQRISIKIHDAFGKPLPFGEVRDATSIKLLFKKFPKKTS